LFKLDYQNRVLNPSTKVRILRITKSHLSSNLFLQD